MSFLFSISLTTFSNYHIYINITSNNVLTKIGVFLENSEQ